MATAPKRKSVTRAKRRPSSSGPPTVVLIGGLLGALAFGGWAFMTDVNSGTNAGTMIAAAERSFANGSNSTDVNQKLLLAESDRSLSEADRQAIIAIRARLKVRDKKVELTAHNSVGTTYLQKKLKNYASKYLEGAPDRPKARVFLQRAQVFKTRWPQHNDVEWVERQEARFEDFVKLSDPATFPDIAWEAEALTYAKPRDYTMAFKALDAFIANEKGDVSGEDRLLASNLKKRLTGERNEYHVDRMLEAKSQFEDQQNEAAAVSWLVWGVIGMADQAKSDEAAGYLLKLPSCDAFLRGYRNSQPLIHERLLTYPLIKARWDAM